MSEQNEELAPCPFCGGEAKTIHDTSSDCERHLDWSATCLNENCGAEILCCASEWQARDAWNTRTDTKGQDDE